MIVDNEVIVLMRVLLQDCPLAATILLDLIQCYVYKLYGKKLVALLLVLKVLCC